MLIKFQTKIDADIFEKKFLKVLHAILISEKFGYQLIQFDSYAASSSTDRVLAAKIDLCI